MITQLSTHDIVDQLMSVEAFGIDGISYKACQVMAEYLEELENDIGEHMELDPIAIRCEYSIYTIKEIAQNYNYSVYEENQCIEDMQNKTTVIHVEGDYYILGEF